VQEYCVAAAREQAGAVAGMPVESAV
jgi:hypothetical protein